MVEKKTDDANTTLANVADQLEDGFLVTSTQMGKDPNDPVWIRQYIFALIAKILYDQEIGD